MIGKIIGAYVGDRLAKKTKVLDGPAGAAIGVAATAVISRLSLPGMIALGAGGYVAKKLTEKNTAPGKTA